jgi:hypothetical protein
LQPLGGLTQPALGLDHAGQQPPRLGCLPPGGGQPVRCLGGLLWPACSDRPAVLVFQDLLRSLQRGHLIVYVVDQGGGVGLTPAHGGQLFYALPI